MKNHKKIYYCEFIDLRNPIEEIFGPAVTKPIKKVSIKSSNEINNKSKYCQFIDLRHPIEEFIGVTKIEVNEIELKAVRSNNDRFKTIDLRRDCNDEYLRYKFKIIDLR